MAGVEIVAFQMIDVTGKFGDGEITFLVDASLSAAGLTISLDGLSVSSPLNHFDPLGPRGPIGPSGPWGPDSP